MAGMINKNTSFPQEPEGKILPRTPRRKLEHITKMGSKETMWRYRQDTSRMSGGILSRIVWYTAFQRKDFFSVHCILP
jgi:hypothetical protein